uniref:Bifunctional protein peroxiredoxin/chitinase n=1 Tax=Clostridioides difficile TaxID=1496 RepID=A0A381I9C3_CLODI|nr:bifunctional protein peroxiredoxin/chitinase [Clostridioides difficile]
MPNLPSLGSKAPDFKANTTNGPIRLSDYKGNWIVLFSHPGDFYTSLYYRIFMFC